MAKRPTCAECGLPFERGQAKQLFCSRACKQVFHNRNMTRGKLLTPLSMAAREGRNDPDAVQAWSLACRMMSDWREEDRAAGRMSMLKFLKHQKAHGIGFMAR